MTWAETISPRRRPMVIGPPTSRRARLAATIAKAIAPASVSMWAASASSASELARIPVVISTAMKATLIASATASMRVLVSAEIAGVWPP